MEESTAKILERILRELQDIKTIVQDNVKTDNNVSKECKKDAL